MGEERNCDNCHNYPAHRFISGDGKIRSHRTCRSHFDMRECRKNGFQYWQTRRSCFSCAFYDDCNANGQHAITKDVERARNCWDGKDYTLFKPCPEASSDEK